MLTDFVGIVGRLVLTAAFTLAALLKLRDRKASRDTFHNFGIPSCLAGPAATIVPLIELAIAASLLPARSALWGAVSALALLLIFTVAIVLNLAIGRAPDCGCFGQFRSKPINWTTPVRNVVLLCVAALVAHSRSQHPVLRTAALYADLESVSPTTLGAGVAIFGVLGFEAFLILELIRQQGRLLLRIDRLEGTLAAGRLAVVGPRRTVQGLQVGAPAPAFTLPTMTGDFTDLATLLRRGSPLLLVFSDPNCSGCPRVITVVKRWQRDFAHQLTTAVISRRPGLNSGNRSLQGVQDVLFQDNREVSELYAAYGTPAAVLVRTDGTIGSSLSFGHAAIEALVSSVGLTELSSVDATVQEMPV
jgi:hypothetical protein